MALVLSGLLISGVSGCETAQVHCGRTCAGRGHPPAPHEISYDNGLIVSTFPGEWEQGRKRVTFRVTMENTGESTIPAGQVKVQMFEGQRGFTLRKFTHSSALERAILPKESVSGIIALGDTAGWSTLDIEVMFRPRSEYDVARWSVVL
ncbi:hypothetical protein [Streptomyces sp. NPDC058869]|uniref:hypothetical protein n=1 Tax=Streptomyces sp. NPDC058869 TaxID=3346659 RepID=UPI003688BEA9